MPGQAVIVTAVFAAAAIGLARTGRRCWAQGRETGAVIALGASTGLVFCALLILILGALS